MARPFDMTVTGAHSTQWPMRLKSADIDGIATAGETPVTVAHYLGLTPKWVDGTAGGVPATARQGRPPGDRS